MKIWCAEWECTLAGETVRVAFVHEAKPFYQDGGWYIDAIEIVGIDPPPPRVAEFLAGPGGAIGAVASLWARFTAALDPATVTADHVKVFADGPDGLLGTPDDIAIAPLSLSYDGDIKQIEIVYAPGFPEDTYRLELSDGVLGTLGLALDGEGNYATDFPDRLPSGDGVAGGDFTARFLIDRTPPPPPAEVRSTSHWVSQASTADVIQVRWTAAVDGFSGTAGYRVGWDTSPNTAASDLAADSVTVQSASSPLRGDGSDHWFHVASVDRAGNLSNAAHLGPFSVETGGPKIAGVAPSNASVDPTPPSEIRVTFQDGDLDMATLNTASFVVQASGGDRSFDEGNEVSINEADGAIAYDAATRTAIFVPAAPLPMDAYRITVTDAVSDRFGNALDGDADGVNGGDLIRFFYLDQAQHVSGTLSANTTWRGLVVVDNSVTVAAGVTLSIEPGTVVKFKDLRRIDVLGTLAAEGTVAQPIVFTSWKDDSVAGDTNGDGDATTPAADDWNGLRFHAAAARGSLRNVRITYGDRAVEGDVGGARIEIRNAVLRENQYGVYVYTALVEIEAENCLMLDNRYSGVFARADSRVVLRNCTLAGNGFGGGSGWERNAIHLGGANVTVENCLLAFNAHGLHHDSDIPLLAVRNSLFHNPAGQEILWDGDPGEPKLDENGNRTGDPLFVDLAAGNYALDGGSPASDAGRGIEAPATDLLGRSRYDDPGMANVGSGSPSFVDIGALERQSPTQPGDLAVIAVASPQPRNVAPGETVTVNWTAGNVGQRSLGGTWDDAIYLSGDPYLSPREDRLLHHEPHSGELVPGTTYQGNWTGAIPTDLAGPYYVLVETNTRASGIAEASLANNVRAAGEVLAVAVPALAATQTGPLNKGQWQFYRFEAQAGDSVRLELDAAASSGSVYLYVRQGTTPTISQYTQAAATPGQPDQQLQFQAPTTAVYYVGVYAQQVASSGTQFTLSARTRGLTIDGVTPNDVGNAGRVTLKIAGDAFDPDVQVQLVRPGVMAVEAEEWYQDAATVFATFDLSAAGAVAGSYDVVVTNPGGTPLIKPAAVTVHAGGAAKLTADLQVADMARPGRTTPVTIQYANTGDVDLPSPLFTVESVEDIAFVPPSFYYSMHVLPWLPQVQHQRVTVGSVSVLGLSPEGPATILRPGQTLTLTIDAVTPFRVGDLPFELYVFGHPGSSGLGDPIDWSQLEEDMRPPDTSDDAWNPLFARLKAQVGNTWSQYLTVLRDNAEHLAELGQRVYEATDLFAFEFVQAASMGTPGYLETVQDAYCPGPGLPLSFERYFLSGPFYRSRLGTLGRGWTHSYEITLQKRSDGSVVVNGASGLDRVFDTDGSGGYVAAPGEYGTLTPEPDGGFLLAEADGLQTRFRPDGLFAYLRDTNGNQVTAVYAEGQLSEVRHSGGDSFRFSYYASGRLRQVTDHGGRATLFSYDGSSEHLTTTTRPDGQVAAYSYITGDSIHRDHQLRSVAYPGGPVAWFSYDVLGRLDEHYLAGIGQPSVKHERVTYGYTTAGTTYINDALGNTATIWIDTLDRMARVEDPMGNAADFIYDSDSNLMAVVGPNGLYSSFEYNSHGKVTLGRDPAGNETSLGYGGASQHVEWVRDAHGNLTRYEYDASGNLTSIIYEDESTEHYTYDAAGKVTSWKNRRGETIAYAADGRGQLAAKDLSETALTLDFVYTHNAAGDLTSATGPEGTTVLSYDPDSGHLVRMDYPAVNGKPIYLIFEYDAAGRRTRSSDQDGHVCNYGYDAAGRLNRMADGSGQLVVDYEYDPAGRLIRSVLGNGVSTTYTYDAAWQLASLSNRRPDGSVLSRFDYTYDELGRRVAMDTHYGYWTYKYDANGQLTRGVLVSSDPDIPDQDLTYVYDALGNRLRTLSNATDTAYTTNSMNQYVQVGNATHVFDADGNLVEEMGPDGTTIYIYDGENRLLAVTCGDHTWRYKYDAMGNRTVVQENNAVTYFVIDPIGLGNVVGEYDAAGNPVVRYDHALGLVSREDAVGNAAYYTFDVMGSTSELTGPGGILVNHYAYDPFGVVLAQSELLANSFEYVGQDGVSRERNALTHMRARFYDPVRGRFLTEDPIGFANIDQYTYAANSPTMLADPLGLQAERRRATTPQTQNETRMSPASFLKRLFQAMLPFSTEAEIIREASDAFGRCAGRSSCLPKSPSGKPTSPANPNRTPVGRGRVPSHGSETPEDKFGPTGSDPAGNGQRFLPGFSDEALSYRIDFWNEPTALVATQDAVIVDELDPNVFDVDSFRFTRFGFLSWDYPLDGVQEIDVRVDLRPEMNLAVEVRAGWELEVPGFTGDTAGKLVWWFHAVDPLTGEYPQDPRAGFLPPFNEETEYELGWVEFTVDPKEGLPTGTRIQNVAYVEFDFLQDLLEHPAPKDENGGPNPWTNTIDAGIPAQVSQVDGLPANTLPGFQVSWSGDQDDAGGSGIGAYDIYYRLDDDDGLVDDQYVLWLQNTAATSAVFPYGVPGHRYSFYSVAIDNVGHAEPAPLAADAQTAVVAASLRLGMAGDSLSDEYAEASYSYAANWVESLAQRVDVGISGAWGSPRDNGFEYNWAQSGATSASLLANGQHTGLAQQIAAGSVDYAVLAIGQNDFGVSLDSEAAYPGIYSGSWTPQQIDAYVGSIVANIETALQTLVAAGGKVVLLDVIDYSGAPLTRQFFSDPVQRERVTDVLRDLRRELLKLAHQYEVPLLDTFQATKDFLGENEQPVDTVLIGGASFSNTAGVEPQHLFVHDGVHPHTVAQAVIANLIATALDVGYGPDIESPVFTEREILELVGRGDEYVSDSLGLDYRRYVYLPDSWQNPLNRYDVTFDGEISAIDVLTNINYINAHPGDGSLPDRPGTPPPFHDVDDNRTITALDVLLVINEINKHVAAAGEGENAERASLVWPSQDAWLGIASSGLPQSFAIGQVESPASSTTHAGLADHNLPWPAESPTRLRVQPIEHCGEQRSAAEFGDLYQDPTWLDAVLPDILADIDAAWQGW